MKTQLILDAIADAEELGVSDAELTEHVIAQAQRYGMSPQEFAQQLTQGGNLPALVADVRRSKALATVLERATVTDASGRAGRPVPRCAGPAAGGERRGRGAEPPPPSRPPAGPGVGAPRSCPVGS